MVWWLVVSMMSGLVAGLIADLRGLTGCGYLLLALFIGPLAIVVALVAPRDAAHDRKIALRRGDLVRCPGCMEAIHPEASICPHCRTYVMPTTPPPSLAESLGKWWRDLPE